MVETKKCTKCGEVKPITEFYKRHDRDGTRSHCKKCENESTNNWRRNHLERANEIVRKCRNLHPERIRIFQFEKARRIKKELVAFAGGKCVRCGYSKCIGALDFHHLDPKDKEKINIMASREDVEILKKLIKAGKVILLCSNCHREEHYD